MSSLFIQQRWDPIPAFRTEGREEKAIGVIFSEKWLMSNFDIGGEVKNDVHSELEFVELQA